MRRILIKTALRSFALTAGLVFLLVLAVPFPAWGNYECTVMASGGEQTTTVTGAVIAPKKPEDSVPADTGTAKTGDDDLPEMLLFLAAVSGTAAMIIGKKRGNCKTCQDGLNGSFKG